MIELDTNIELATARALEPLDEYLEVEPYGVHLDHAGVLRMAAHFGIPAANLDALAAEMRHWSNHEGGVDRDGRYELTTCNPDGRWDWYEIGGRWAGRFNGRDSIPGEELARAPYLKKCLPFYVLTPEGKWLEHERTYLVGNKFEVETETLEPAEWLAIVRQQRSRRSEHVPPSRNRSSPGDRCRV